VVAYTEAIRLDSKESLVGTVVYYWNKGEALFVLHRYQEALAIYDQALRLDPNHPGLHLARGSALVSLGRYEEALAAYEQTIRLDPTIEQARSYRDEVLRRLGEAKQVRTKYWVIRRGRRDKDSHGNIHSMEKYAGPFTTREEASTNRERVIEQQRDYFNRMREVDKSQAEEFSWVVLETDYLVLTDNELEEARRKGIRIY